MDSLPPELIDLILSNLDDEGFLACREASSIYHVSLEKEVQRRTYSSRSIFDLIREDDLSGIKWCLFESGRFISLSENGPLTNCLMKHGSSACFKLFQKRFGDRMPVETAKTAVKFGNLDVLRYLYFINFKGRSITSTTIYFQNLEIIRWWNTIKPGVSPYSEQDIHDSYDYKVKEYLRSVVPKRFVMNY